MKQIFDWLREQMRNKSHKAWDGDNKKEIMLLFLPDVEEFINEAEAKWESECCEWKRGSENKDILFAPHEQVSAIYESCLPMYPYCSVCGKPIKISEVE